MGIKKNADASYNLGLGVSDANDYKGFAGQNEITIQLTADGATDKSMDALNYLKTFAINQAAAGLPIKPSASVSISANGYTKALEADDFEITETGVKIGGIEYTASTDSWDFTNALVPSGGGGGGAFPITDTYDSDEETHTLNKTWQEIFTAFTSGYTCYVIVENVGGLSGTTDYNLVLCIESASESYSVISSDGSIYVADATSGYPTKSN